MESFILYITCLILGGAGAWSIGKFAPRLGLIDCPNERSSHAVPTPRGGGVGILAAFVLSSLTINIPAGFWLPATILALISFYGDKFSISPKIRLPIQFIAALFLIQPSAFSLQPSAFLLFSLVVFIVGTANFYNFMDGINGIAGITGIIAFGLLALSTSLSGEAPSFVILALCISLSCLGFLPFNMPKARVFMGDVGSILLGFVFASMVIRLSKNLLDFICLSAFLFPFYADELTTMIVRLKDGETLIHPHRKHLYQILANEVRIPHWKVSGGYGLLQLLIGISVLLVRPLGSIMVLPLLMIFFAGFVLLTIRLRSRTAHLTARAQRKTLK
ncbi:MAG: glycosyltransferase family 4 protein [Thermodesulfobacteriota bacterium]